MNLASWLPLTAGGEFTQPRAHLLAAPCRSQVKRYPSHQSKPQGTTALTRVNTTLASCKRSLRGRTSICRKSSLTRRALAQSAVRLGRRSRPAGTPRRSGIRCPGVGSSTEAGRSSAINISVADQLWPPNQQHEGKHKEGFASALVSDAICRILILHVST